MPFSGAARPSFSWSNSIDVLAAIGVERADGRADRAGWSAASPRTCRAGRGTRGGRPGSGWSRAASSRREATESRIERMEPVASDSAPVRSRSMVAIGASRTGRSSRRDAGIGDAEGVDPADLGIKPQHLAEGVEDAGDQHADDQAIQAGIGHEAMASCWVWPSRMIARSPARIRNTSMRHRKTCGRDELDLVGTGGAIGCLVVRSGLTRRARLAE